MPSYHTIIPGSIKFVEAEDEIEEVLKIEEAQFNRELNEIHQSLGKIADYHLLVTGATSISDNK
jgi:hypothetical protein